jgi:hypothetical protein
VLHHDNAQVHTAVSIREFLAKKNIHVLPHPPYSPELASCDFCLFPMLKLKGHHFGTMENTQKNVTDELQTLTENDFVYCFNQWKNRWKHCVASKGSYFEGDNLQFQLSPIDVKKSIPLFLGQPYINSRIPSAGNRIRRAEEHLPGF